MMGLLEVIDKVLKVVFGVLSFWVLFLFFKVCYTIIYIIVWKVLN
jgi:hypothetical protein